MERKRNMFLGQGALKEDKELCVCLMGRQGQDVVH